MKLSSLLEKGRYWKTYFASHYWALSEQERLGVNVLGVVLSIALCYSAIWRPLVNAADNAKQAYSEEAELVTWIKANESEFKKLTASNSAVQGQRAGRSLLSVVTETAQKNQIALTRFEPINDQGLHIWLERVPFNQLVSWLYELDMQGVVLENLQLEHQIEGGQVNVVLILK